MPWGFLSNVVCLSPSSPLKQKTRNWVTCTQQKLPACAALELEVWAQAAGGVGFFRGCCRWRHTASGVLTRWKEGEAATPSPRAPPSCETTQSLVF